MGVIKSDTLTNFNFENIYKDAMSQEQYDQLADIIVPFQENKMTDKQILEMKLEILELLKSQAQVNKEASELFKSIDTQITLLQEYCNELHTRISILEDRTK